MKPLTIEELKALEVDDWVECDWDNYGKTWLAYKNKEQEEAKGEIVELPCILKSNSTYPKNQVVYINEFGSVIVERFSYEQEAERRLAELIGGIMKPSEEINKMTPLEYARYRASLPPREDCVTCANCVEVDGFYYCETNGKILIPRYMNMGRCPEIPSKFKAK